MRVRARAHLKTERTDFVKLLVLWDRVCVQGGGGGGGRLLILVLVWNDLCFVIIVVLVYCKHRGTLGRNYNNGRTWYECANEWIWWESCIWV